MNNKKDKIQGKKIKSKMLSIFFYGMVLLLSVITFYFVTTSSAQNVLKIDVSVIDKLGEIARTNYEVKVAEEENEYLAELADHQNGYFVKDYIVVSEEEFRKIALENGEDLEESEEQKEDNIEIREENSEEITEEKVEDKIDVENVENLPITSGTEKTEEATEETKSEEANLEPEIINAGARIKLTKEQIESKKVYLVANYDFKEVDDKVLYKKLISTTTDENSISIIGYMPQNAEISVENVEKEQVEKTINKGREDNKKGVSLLVAYDIKIMVDGESFEPEDFDEKVRVIITGIEEKNINIWHINKDNEVEIIDAEKEKGNVDFDTMEFSVYGVEVLQEEGENVEEQNEGEETVEVVENKREMAPPLRTPALNLPDSTLEIDDYDSDKYYYKGMNYTGNISGEYVETYTDSNLVRVTLNYHGFEQGETNPEMKGRISLDETYDIVKNIRCVPVLNGNVTIELMDNPFMDKPTGYGFGGWTTNAGTVSKDSKTLTQTLTITTSTNITVNLYANWEEATVVYLNPDYGSDNGLYDGLSEDEPFGSWSKAFDYLASHNKNDREKNIIVLTGNIDSSINYSRQVNKTLPTLGTVAYKAENTITSGSNYVISSSSSGSGGNAIRANGNNVGNRTLNTTTEPATDTQWTVTSSGSGYTIRNVSTGRYLTCSNNGNLSMGTTATVWTYNTNNHYLYYASGRNNYYLTYYGGWDTETYTYYADPVYFLTYTVVTNENADDYATYTRGSLNSNGYYNSNNSSVPVTVTSLYNHTDYRNNASISLTSSSYMNFKIYKDFQMNHVKITAEGYKSNSSGTSFSNPKLTGYNHNVRLGRGIICTNDTDTSCTFANIIGGDASVGSTSNDNNAYKLIVESGKYSSIQGFNYYNGSSRNYYGTIFLVLGNDIDRKLNNNNDLSVYYRTTMNSGSGVNGKINIRDKAWQINVKSGKFGVDYFEEKGKDYEDSAYSGIYMGGYGTSTDSNTRDRSDRYLIAEGGLIANLIGGLKATQNSGVQTRMYVKGGEIYNIVGGAGVSATYENRFIQVTGGTIRYSISGGSNGVYASSNQNNGKLNGSTLVYIGGNAQVGTNTTAGETLYGVEAGCVLGAGNGTSNTTYKATSGQVNTSHVIINDSAHILNNVFGGGNYGVVGTSGSTTGTTKIDILGGTIDGNVYGGANQNNIYGPTLINVKGGQVKGAVYGGSNSSGTISSTSTINVTGGTLGQSTNTTSNEVLFGGGYGSSTVVTGNATVNILDTDNNVNIYGSAYGGSSQGAMSGNVVVNIKDNPSVPNTISIDGNVFAGGKGTTNVAATIAGNATMNVDGSNLPNASVFGGNDINGVTNGNITVKIGENNPSILLNAYGGGNLDDTGTEADTVKVYLLSNANVTNAFNGGKSADLMTGGTNDTTRAIYLQGGTATNLFGGSDTLGDVTASHVYIENGNATNVYGGNNKGGQTAQSFVYITGGTTENVYGGGYEATTPITNVSLTGGTITNGYGGGNAANVTTANIILNGTNSTNIFGGSNSSGTVGTSNVTITSGTVTNVYGGNNAGGDTVNTNVLVTHQVENVYGGGNNAETSGNTNLKLLNATVTGDAYGGGNGASAIVRGNSITRIEGTTNISGDLFGGGNAAANGIQGSTNSIVSTYITGGTILGDVYGAANTSVVYGDTMVKIGEVAVNDNTMVKGNIYIGGTVFGGGKSNTAGSENYDFTFESVTRDAYIDINAAGYDNGTYTFDINKSIFGSGNAAKISGYGIVNILNYGSSSNIKNNVSIQRASQVTLDNCYIALEGTTDTTNEIATAVYTFNRIDDLRIKNNTTLYLASGMNIVAKMQSLDSSGNKETVQIGTNGITSQSVDNRIYLSQGRNIILKTEAGTDGEVYGMAFVGLYKGTTSKEFGIYGTNYSHGDTVTKEVAELFNRNSYVQGKHYTSHNIEVDGFYTNYNNEGVIETAYINPTPEDAVYYQWIIGNKSTDIYFEDIELIATKYATTATYVLNLNGLSYPNMTINVKGINVSELSDEISLNEPGTIPNIAATAEEADSKFGLIMTAGNNGWQTRGSTYYLNNDDVQAGMGGRLQYVSDNSTTTPSFSLYMAHSKNISTTTNLGTVTIQLEAIYEENEEIKMKNVFIVIKMTTNNTLQIGNDYYEGAITPGKEFSIFPTTTTTITQNSSFSAYYSLFLNNYSSTNYYEGFTGHYYHTFESSCVLPEHTKITFIDLSGSNVKYYYYQVTAEDESSNKKVYRFTDFYAMDSTDEHYNADGSYYNSDMDLVFEEFIIHVDFEDTNLEDNLESKNIVVQLRDKYDDIITLTVNTAAYPMLFSVYNDIDVNKSLDLTTDKNVIYMGANLALNIETTYGFNKNENSDIVYETTHIEDQLGVRITISTGSDILTASNLEGIYITYKGANYFPRADGSYRIKIADAVSNVIANMTLNTENGQLSTGTYTITAQSFGSIDGTYFSREIASDSVNIQVVSTNYGFLVELDNNSVLIDKATGKTKNDDNYLNFTLGYSGGFEHPKITVALYRRKYDQVISYEYEKVDLEDYVINELMETSVENEYLVTDLVQNTQSYTLTLKDSNLVTGTYKIIFTLYDGNNIISQMDKSIIIK